jgi:hypothetical protein
MRRLHKIFKIDIIFIVLILTASACRSAPTQVSVPTDFKAPRYPVFLVHGIGFTSENLTFNYWEGITPILDVLGVPWFTSSQPAFGLIEENAQILKKDIEEWLEKTSRNGEGQYHCPFPRGA